MVWLLRKCTQCTAYTLRTDKCSTCGGNLAIPHPPPFSLHDRYRAYRRRLKEISEDNVQER